METSFRRTAIIKSRITNGKFSFNDDRTSAAKRQMFPIVTISFIEKNEVHEFIIYSTIVVRTT